MSHNQHSINDIDESNIKLDTKPDETNQDDFDNIDSHPMDEAEDSNQYLIIIHI